MPDDTWNQDESLVVKLEILLFLKDTGIGQSETVVMVAEPIRPLLVGPVLAREALFLPVIQESFPELPVVLVCVHTKLFLVSP